MKQMVLVTGGTGFLGAHSIVQLLQAGYRVRTTVRSLARESDVRALVKGGGGDVGADDLSFAVADLMSDAGWLDATAGCDFVLHVASPFPASAPKNEDDLIIPARDGTLRVLRAARDSGVKRVVLTSSFAAIGYGHQPTDRAFTEETWSDLDGKSVGAYPKSKTLAERAAWEFIKREGNGLELAVINPVGIFGPVLGSDLSASVQLIKRLMKGAMPGSPQISFGIVDVRDVADLHLRAMTNPAANGERFLAVAGDPLSINDVANVLRAHFGATAGRLPAKVIPNWTLRLASLFDPSLRSVVPDLGKVRKSSNEKAKRVLRWEPRSNEEALIATAQSILSADYLSPGLALRDDHSPACLVALRAECLKNAGH